MKKYTIISFILCLVFFLTCCGTSSERDDFETKGTSRVKGAAGLIKDMDAAGLPYEDSDAEIKSVSIIKRQTDKAAKTDLVYVTIEAESAAVHYTRSFLLTYGLYDQGWILDQTIPYPDGPHDARPLTGPGDDLIDKAFETFNKQSDDDPEYSFWSVTGRTVDLEKCEAAFQIEASRETDFISTNEAIVLPCRFSEEGYWYVSQPILDSVAHIDYDWSNLIGAYEYDRNQLSITSVDWENQVVNLHLRLNFWSGSLDYDGAFNFSDYGVYEDLMPYFKCVLDESYYLWVATDAFVVVEVNATGHALFRLIWEK